MQVPLRTGETGSRSRAGTQCAATPATRVCLHDDMGDGRPIRLRARARRAIRSRELLTCPRSSLNRADADLLHRDASTNRWS